MGEVSLYCTIDGWDDHRKEWIWFAEEKHEPVHQFDPTNYNDVKWCYWIADCENEIEAVFQAEKHVRKCSPEHLPFIVMVVGTRVFSVKPADLTRSISMSAKRLTTYLNERKEGAIT